jgi:hypothetical protein
MTELAITYRDPRELKPAARNAPVFDGKQGTWSQEICPSCFTQFDLDDDDRS